jgi:DNA-binding PadR family transcriptional regulator
MKGRVDDLGRFSEPAVLVLSSLAEGPKHGYAITQDVRVTYGIELGPGTLYAALARLERRGLIEALASEDRRRPYRLTATGAAALERHLTVVEKLARTGLRRLAEASI